MAIPKPKPGDWTKANSQVLVVADREILEMLRASKKRVDEILADLPEGKQLVKRAQLENTRARLLAEQGRVFTRLGDITAARRATAASRAARLSAASEAALLSLVGKSSQAQFLYDSALQVSQRAIDVALQRMGFSALPLSQRIYNTNVWMDGRLGKLINQTLAVGLDARAFAKTARDWFNPNTPGGVRYAAMRLARTEINNAFHSISAQKYAETPWITEVEWNLSGSHVVPDECNEFAKASPYKSDDVPARPHPQCLCNITPKSIEEEEFVDNFLKGDYDEYLDAELEKNGWFEADAEPAREQAAAESALKGDVALQSVPKGLPKRGSLTAPQRKALKDYESANFRAINGVLRRGADFSVNNPALKPLKRAIDGIDSAMQGSVLPKDVEAWRGMVQADRLFGDRLKGDLTGFSWKEQGYSSTSTEQKIAKSFLFEGQNDSSGDVLIKVNVPAGTQGVQISESYGGNQAEILLQRNLDWTITKDSRDESGRRILEATVKPADQRTDAIAETQREDVRPAVRPDPVSSSEEEVNRRSPLEIAKSEIRKKVDPVLKAAAELSLEKINELVGPKVTRVKSVRQARKKADDLGGGQFAYCQGGHVHLAHDLQDSRILIEARMVGSGRFGQGYMVRGDGDGFHSITAHEMGHALLEHQYLSKAQEVELRDVIVRALGLPNGNLSLYQLVNGDRGDQPNAKVVSQKISGYARRSSDEMLAEIWAEYVHGSNPAPHIKTIGDKIVALIKEGKRRAV